MRRSQTQTSYPREKLKNKNHSSGEVGFSSERRQRGGEAAAFSSLL